MSRTRPCHRVPRRRSDWRRPATGTRFGRFRVRTSAGSIVGALLRLGVDTEELVRLVRPELADPLPAHLRVLHQSSIVDTPSMQEVLLRVRPPTLRSTLDAARHHTPWPWLLSWARSARCDLQPLFVELDRLGGDRWPTGDLKLCAVTAHDGKRQVLASSSNMRLSTAVAASCSVPGLFRPQIVDGTRLVDGGSVR